MPVSGWCVNLCPASVQGHVKGLVGPRWYQCQLTVPLSSVPVFVSTSNNAAEWSVAAPALPARNTQDRALIWPHELGVLRQPCDDAVMTRKDYRGAWAGRSDPRN